MKLIYNKIFLEHDIDHPENKTRLKYFYDTKETKIENGEQYLMLVHTKEHIDNIKKTSNVEGSIGFDTMTCKRSYEVACYAVGAAIQAAKKGGFALVRPPGHHATKYQAMGFCLFNNIAIASKYLLNEGKRVFILDFDIHHGNGTQDILLGEKNVVYFSTHQSPCYPGTGLKDEKNCINIPLPLGTVDDVYIKQLEERLIPAIKAFNPDIVGVSAGFDSYYKDYHYMNPTVGFKLTKKSYEKIKDILQDYKNFFVLEGGYNPESIKDGVEIFLD
ncbi:MAG: histone deacetylase [Spirochaetales bacterium]|nr:histone deacetylase [Spirochaetales bacterium]